MAYSKRYPSKGRRRAVSRRKRLVRRRLTRTKRVRKVVRRGKYGSKPKMTESSKQLAVYQNPFSVATQQPKIPDGQRNFSLGTSFRSQLSIGTTTGNVLIVLYPGVQSFAAIYNTLAAPTSLPAFAALPTDMMTRPAASGGLNVTGSNIKVVPDELEGWRCVSAGIKIKSINNSLNNEGMYQAIRLRQCNYVPTIADNTSHLPQLDNVPAIAEWSNDPTYVSGALKTIGKHSFQLAVENNLHPFVTWGTDGVDMTNPDYFSSLYDNSFDIVLIHINGSATTKLMLDGFYNIEQTFRAGTQLNYYQTQTMQVAPALLSGIQNKIKYKCRKA